MTDGTIDPYCNLPGTLATAETDRPPWTSLSPEKNGASAKEREHYRMYCQLLEHSGEKIGSKESRHRPGLQGRNTWKEVATAIIEATGNLRLNGGHAEVLEKYVELSIRSKIAESYRESYGGLAITASDKVMSCSLAPTYRRVHWKTLTSVRSSHPGDGIC
jgi:hypothetical protein